MAKTATINIYVELDDKQIPEKITWQASDSGEDELKECDSFSLSVWDTKEKNTLGLDLWTKQMTVLDMYKHFSQTLQKMAHSAERATANEEVSALLREFSKTFVEKIEQVLAKENANNRSSLEANTEANADGEKRHKK